MTDQEVHDKSGAQPSATEALMELGRIVGSNTALPNDRVISVSLGLLRSLARAVRGAADLEQALLGDTPLLDETVGR